MKLKFFVSQLIILATVVFAFAAPGDIDATFGTNGKTVLTNINGISVLPSRTALQPDGKIIFAGNNNTGFSIELVVARINADGSLDTTFGTGGVSRISFGDLLSLATDVAVQADGKIVVAGAASNGFGADLNFAVARLNANGSLDTAFDGDGKVTTSFDGNLVEAAFGVAIQTDGKIIAAGSRQNSATEESWFAVARYNANGALDATFDGDGRFFAKAGVNNEISNVAGSVAVQNDGKIIIAGETSSATDSQFALIRLNNNGALDASFDADGKVQTRINGFGTETANSVAVQTDGKIITAGYADTDPNSGGGNDDFAVVRYNANGALDANFSGDGKTTLSFGSALNFEQAYSVIIQTNGKILVGGLAGVSNGKDSISSNYAVAKLNSDGSTDGNFGNGGFVRTALDESISFGYELLLQADNKIILGGISGNGPVDEADFSPTFVRYLNEETATPNQTEFDYDGDGKADVSVFRPSNGGWYVSNSSNGSFFGTTFGQNGDAIAPADFDGDGKTDISVFRNGNWYRLNSSNGTFTAVSFGTTDDLPVPADFDGDNKADINVFRPSNGTWYRLDSSNGNFVGQAFGTNGDKPVIGDFDGDGKADLAVYRPSAGSWYRLDSSNGNFTAVSFGVAEDKPVAADYDGDGKTDIAVYRPSNGTWYLLQSQAGFAAVSFGVASDLPSAADYDGDGRADIAVFRNGVWYLNRSSQGFTSISFGISNDLPTPNAFVR